jgi:WD40 repeat protein
LLEVPGDGLRHPTYSPTGHILYERETTNPGIWAVPFSLDRLETTGPPFPVAPGGSAPSLARDGTLCFVRVDDTPVQLVRVTRAGVAEPVAELAGTKAAMLMRSPMGGGTRQWAGVSLSPDGTRVAISLGFTPGQLAVYDLTRGALSLVASGVFPSRAVWVDHGDRLVYGSSRGARAWNLWSRRADGGGEEERWSTSDEVQLPNALTPDGTTLLYSEGSGPQGTFRRMPAVAGGRATQLFANRVWGLAASVSPDGRYVAHESPESGRSEIYVQPYPEGDERFQVSTEGGESPVWTRSGEIVYLSGASVMSVSVGSRAGSRAFSKPVVLFGTGGDGGLAPVFDVAPDGRSLYMLRARGRQRVSLVFNWPRDLARVLDELNMAR